MFKIELGLLQRRHLGTHQRVLINLAVAIPTKRCNNTANFLAYHGDTIIGRIGIVFQFVATGPRGNTLPC